MRSRDLVIAARDGVRSGLMRALGPLEGKLVHSADPSRHREIFIIGAPRSGSTLFYELLVTRFGFSYFSNFAHAFYDVPATATLLAQRRLRRYRGRYESDYARIPGWSAPNEGVRIWRRWLPEEDYLDRALQPSEAAKLRGTVAAISKILDAPFVNKNTMHSVHLRVLDAVFPHSVFIEVRRGSEANVRSILRMRLEKLGSDRVRQWWSVRPRRWHEFQEESAVVQACAQVLLTERDIDTDMRELGPERHLVVGYESLCRDTRSSLDAVGDFLERHSIPARLRSEIPRQFPFPRKPVLPSEMDGAIDRSLESVRDRLGPVQMN